MISHGDGNSSSEGCNNSNTDEVGEDGRVRSGMLGSSSDPNSDISKITEKDEE